MTPHILQHENQKAEICSQDVSEEDRMQVQLLHHVQQTHGGWGVM